MTGYLHRLSVFVALSKPANAVHAMKYLTGATNRLFFYLEDPANANPDAARKVGDGVAAFLDSIVKLPRLVVVR